MLQTLGYSGLEELIDSAVPDSIRTHAPLHTPAARTESEVLGALRSMAERNEQRVQMIGLGYYDTVTPAVLRRNMLEAPGWYTSYTPYQPEISQGRLEALLNFQTMVEDLTGLPVAGASLLDEATAVVEAILLMRRANKSAAANVVIDSNCFPQTLAVARARAEAVGIELVEHDTTSGLPDGDFFGVVIQNPGSTGCVRDLSDIISRAHQQGALVTVATDLLALTVFKEPGAQHADIAVGSAQRFGVPLFFGGPHAGFMAVRQGLERMLPGRLVGVSRDVDGAVAYRLALQTREQHIRRDKATSNICTAQALLANVAGMYAAYHGASGLRAIAARVHGHATTINAGLRAGGVTTMHADFFDTVVAGVGSGRARAIVLAADRLGINLRLIDEDTVGIACDEMTTDAIVADVLKAFGIHAEPVGTEGDSGNSHTSSWVKPDLARTSSFMTADVFHRYRSEAAMQRYLRRLSDKDLALDRTMIPLGSCTMKLNSAVEMEPISWPGFAGIHPYAPTEQTRGYRELIADLETWLADITGYDRVSLQPNAGSQGELAGLLAIRNFHRSGGDDRRDICLIPQSAHGTNAASAVLAGLKVVVVATADTGDIDLDDLQSKLDGNGDRVAAIMLTYPSTHGVYETNVRQICDLVHDAGGQVYVDGANLNALVGLARPGEFGGDVSHLNLHKTFCIPHGGGGPGVGPVAVRQHLAPFLPSHPLDTDGITGPVAAAPHGSAGILPITWAYIALMGPEGLTAATRTAVLAANYLANELADCYPTLFSGSTGLVAHECILDLRALTKATGVTAEDVAKRLIDFGFHAPTLSFPVNGTLMVEPTESEDIAELDRFVAAMKAIRAEIQAVADGQWPLADSPLRQAPHTAECLLEDAWPHPYSRRQAAYPLASSVADKYFPPVRRIDGVFGDRNLVCSCPPPEAFAIEDTQREEVSA
ncbi:aminomethyl-transferring glycine dehydrogenase [Williamsia sp. D3]|uniref:aminomethyl-transferring glycine dehydrogenase n=1 Tax=Williamsia sp. D3 TaxID=1313067 RepID=UPI00041553BB|nr:aminomethyl-transferring glycine dehydrogenase [Williamsia sp. D3]